MTGTRAVERPLELIEEEPPAASRSVREVRIALVCYGGVSLAIYMHGITKELQSLVAASTAYARDPETNPFRGPGRGAHGTAAVYWDLLSELERGRHGGRLAGVAPRVVIDIISGTSAGGINGICLGKALVQGRSQDALRSVWFDRGDIAVLVGAPEGPRWAKRFVAAVRALYRVARHRPPLRGDAMCGWIEDALRGIDEGEPLLLDGNDRPVPLVAPVQGLRLFVPVTDFRGLHRSVMLHDPDVVWDRTHRQVLRFDERDGSSPSHQFGASWNHALGFAARATSSFPGAFPPISPAAYDEAVGSHGLDRQLAGLFPHHALADVGTDGDDAGAARPPYRSPFVDGGVLDNFPFGASIDAIRSAPAAGDVDRRLLYIEPDPGGPNAPAQAGAVPEVEEPVTPGLLETVLDSYAGIPRQEPLLEDLLQLARHNATVQRLRSVIVADFPMVRSMVDEAAAAEGVRVPIGASPAHRQAVRRRMRGRVADAVGLAHATYVRLRLSDVVDGYAGVVSEVHRYPADSNHAWLVRAMLREWARQRGILEPDGDLGVQIAFLEGLDLQYQRRRIQFLLAACHWWYRDLRDDLPAPGRSQLDEAKRSLYALRAELDGVGAALLTTPEVGGMLADLFGRDEVRRVQTREVEVVVAEKRPQLDRLEASTRRILGPLLADWEAALDERLEVFTTGWPDDTRAAFQARDLGFPVWDAITYPIQSLSGVGERDHVEVVRMSPGDARLLTEAGAVRELAGVKLGHFGAFFDRPGRERDYLWGRLDAVERLVRILLDDPDTASLEPLDRAGVAACRRGFEAVLDAEEPALGNIGAVFGPLRAAVGEVSVPPRRADGDPTPVRATDGDEV